jgi:general secretion pathway protein G
MYLRRPRKSHRTAFTLVELLIVLGILVLLLSMVVPRFLGSQKKAKIDTTKAQIGMFRAALEHYYLDCNQFPSTEQGLDALMSRPADLPENATWNSDGYVSAKIGLDPWGNEYQYEYPPSHGTMDAPDIWSYGPDGEEGTDDDICSWGNDGGAGSGEGAGGEPRGPRPEGGPSKREGRKPSSKPIVPKAIRSDRPDVK